MWLNVLKLIRWPNLLIVFLTQWIVWSRVISTSLHTLDLTSRLSFLHLFLLSLSTVFVAAAGYIINDIYDVHIDLINKPSKVIVGRLISIQLSYLYYYLVLGLGASIVLYLGIVFNKLLFVLLYPAVAGILHLYAMKLKKTVLVGNIIISMFVGLVPFIPLLADLDQVRAYSEPRILQLLSLYGSLAFLSNLAREIVKDMQDIKGDKAYDAKTFPILFGISRSKKLLYLILFSIILLLVHWSFFYDGYSQSTAKIAFGTIPLLTICFSLLITLPKLKSPTDFGKWSLGIKVFMLCGLLFLYLQTI